MKKRKIPKVDVLELPARLQKQIGKLQVCAESLLEEVYAFEEIVARQADEINILKGQKKRPVFKPSRMHQDAAAAESAAEVEKNQFTRIKKARWFGKEK